MNRNDICVVLVTFNRTEYAVRTIRAAIKNLKFDRNIYWYLADAGSREEHYKACQDELGQQQVIGTHHEYISPGHNWNRAFNFAFEKMDFVLRLEDDFELQKELNITPYVVALEEKPLMGIVRLGGLPVGLDCGTIGINGIHYLLMYRTTQYAYSGNPLIMHKRFWDHYGGYHEDMKPGTTELEYDNRFREKDGPAIIWPVEIGGWSCFGHIGAVKSIE